METQANPPALDPINAHYKEQRNEAWDKGLDLYQAADRLMALIRGKMAAEAPLDPVDLSELALQLDSLRPFFGDVARYLGRE
jgi:hypothetical protein